MKRVATRQDEETYSLKKYLENQGKDYEPSKAFWPPQNDPRDVSYDGINFQITYGNQKVLANRRMAISKEKFFLTISGRPDNYDEIFAGIPLKKKRGQSDKKITLLIDCTGPEGFYDPEMIERKKFFEDFIKKNEGLIKSWQDVILIFHDGNITLT